MRKAFTEAEDQFLWEWYAARSGGALCINDLSVAMERSHASVAIRASRLGICEQARPMTEAHRNNSARAQEIISRRPEVIEKRRRDKTRWIAENGHPRGMLGKTHSQKARDAISAGNNGRIRPQGETEKMIKTKLARYGTLAPKVRRGTWRAGWRTIGGVRSFYRSTWEANFARHLERLAQRGEIAKWEHEPAAFTFPGVGTKCASYTPDFRITHLGNSIQFAEVKGWEDKDSLLKIARMEQFYPKVWLTVFGKKWFRKNARWLSKEIPDWEQAQ